MVVLALRLVPVVLAVLVAVAFAGADFLVALAAGVLVVALVVVFAVDFVATFLGGILIVLGVD